MMKKRNGLWKRLFSFGMAFALCITAGAGLLLPLGERSTARAASKAYTQVEYIELPPAGETVSIGDRFAFVGNCGYDMDYPNVAVVANDTPHTYGAMWSREPLQLNQPFNTIMYLYLAHNSSASSATANLGDGMTFTLQNDPRGAQAIGSDGEGLGVYGSERYYSYPNRNNPLAVIENAVTIEFDLYGNYYTNKYSDPHYIRDPASTTTPGWAHCAAIYPPTAPLTNPNDTLGYVWIDEADHLNNFFFEKKPNWLEFSMSWEPYVKNGVAGGLLIYTLAGTQKTLDIPNARNVFKGDTAYWGFTGSTGDSTAILAAAIVEWPNQNEITATKYVTDETGQSLDGGYASEGDTLFYSLHITPESLRDTSGIGPIVITDTLSPYVTYTGAPVQIVSGSGTITTVMPQVNGTQLTIDTGISLMYLDDVMDLEFEVTVNAGAAGNIVENIAMADAGGLDAPVETNKTTVTIVERKPPYKKVISDIGKDGAQVKIGDEMTYAITYGNLEPGPAALTLRDPLPSDVDFVSATEGGVYDAGTHTVTWALGELPSGTMGEVQLVVRVNESASAKIINSATLQVENNPELTSNIVVNPTEPPAPYKSVTSDAGKDGAQVGVGSVLTYSISYENPADPLATPGDPGSAQDIVITDRLPDGVDFISASRNSTYNEATHTVTWTLPGVAPGAHGRVSTTVAVNERAIVQIDNTATLVLGNNPAISSNTVTNPVKPAHPKKEVVSDVGHNGAAVTTGNELIYGISYENNEASPATITITDRLPSGVDYLPSAGGEAYDFNSHTVTWTLQNVPSGARGEVRVKVRVNERAVVRIINYAVVQVGGSPSMTTNLVENPVTPGTPTKEVIGEKGKEGSRVAVGDQLVYRISYQNYDTSPAAITIVDRLPDGTDFVSCSAGGVYDAASRKVTWIFENVASGQSGTVTLTVEVNEQAIVVIENFATVKVGDHNPMVTNTTGNPTDPKPPHKQVVSDIGRDGATVAVGDTLRYSISYENNEPTPANVVVKDPLPDGVDYAGCSDNGVYDQATHTVTWTFPGLASGTRGNVTVDVTVNEKAIVKIQNSATMAVGDHPAQTSNIVENPIEPPPPYKKVTSETGKDGASVTVGDELTYAISYANNESAAADVIITDKLPDGVDYISCSDNGVYVASTHTVTWAFDSLASGTRGEVTADVTVNEKAIVKIENSATMQVGDKPSQRSNIVENPLDPAPPYKKVTSEAGRGGASVAVGDELQYSISYANNESAAADVVIIDKLPDGVDYVGCSDNGVYAAGAHTVTWTFKNLASGARGEVTVDVVINEKAIVWVENSATMQVGNNPAQTSNIVRNPLDPAPPYKKVISETGMDGASVAVGDELTYSISYANNEESIATVVVTDKLPEGVDYINSTNGGVYDKTAHTVTWTFRNLASGTFGAVHLTVQVNEKAVVRVENSATMQVGNNPSQTSNVVRNPLDPAPPYKKVISEAGKGGASVAIGDELTYSISYLNDEESAATVVITDKLPDGVDYVSNTGGGSYDQASHTVTWTFNNLASGAGGMVTVDVTVNEKATVKIENSATVQVGDKPSQQTNIVRNPLDPAPPYKKITSEEGKDGASVAVGDELQYSISYANTESAAADVVVIDHLPEGVDYVSNTGGGIYNQAAHTVTWTFKNLASGAGGTVTVDVVVNENAIVTIENTATMQVGDNPSQTSNVVKNPVDPTPPYKKVISETGMDGASVAVGDELTYSISYANGESAAADVVVIDRLPEGLDYLSSTDGGVYDKAAHTVTWTFKNLASGARGTVNLDVRVNEKAVVKIQNSVTMQIGDNPARQSNIVENPLDPQPPYKKVTSEEGKDGATVAVGDALTYSISYANNESAAADITLTDKLPEGVDYLGSTDGGVYDKAAHTVTWAFKNLASGTRGAVSLRVRVNEKAVVKVENTATMQVGNNPAQTSNTVENPVTPTAPYKKVTSEAGKDGATVSIGDTLKYSITYANTEAAAATVVVKDKLPNGVDYISSSNGGVYNRGTHTVTWTFENLAGGTRGELALMVRVNEKALVKIENSATMQVGNNPAQQSNIVENPLDPAPPDKKVTSEAGKDGAAVSVGDELTYSISYANTDDAPADVVIIDRLSKGTDYVSSSDGGVYNRAAHTVTWTFKNLPSGTAGTVRVVVKVNESAVTIIENDATMQVGDHDPLVSNKTSNNVIPRPDHGMSRSKVASPQGTATRGGEITYRITVKNTGSDTLVGVRVRDYIPAYTAYVPNSASTGGTYGVVHSEDCVTWFIREIKPGESVVLSFRVRVSEAAPENHHIKNYGLVEETGSHTPPIPLSPKDPSEQTNIVDNTIPLGAPSTNTSGSNGSGSSGTGKVEAPQTGDNSYVLLWVIVGMICLMIILLMAAMIVKAVRNNREKSAQK